MVSAGITGEDIIGKIEKGKEGEFKADLMEIQEQMFKDRKYLDQATFPKYYDNGHILPDLDNMLEIMTFIQHYTKMKRFINGTADKNGNEDNNEFKRISMNARSLVVNTFSLEKSLNVELQDYTDLINK